MFGSKWKLAACLTALVSLALAPACKKEGGGGGGVSKEAGAALNYIPKNAKIVGGINLSSAANSKVLSKYKEKILASAPPDFQEMQKACGIDVFTDIKSIVVGMVGKERGVFVVTGNLKKDTLEKCMAEAAAKEGKTLNMADDGKLRHYSGTGEDLYVYWADGMLVAAPGQMGGKDMLNAVVNGEKLGEGEVMNMVKSTGTNTTFWLAGVLDAELTAEMPMGGGDMKSMAITINTGDNLDVKALVNFNSAAKAEEAETGARMGLAMASGSPMAKPFESIIKKIKIELDGKAVKAGVSLSPDDLAKLESVAGMF